MQAATLDELIDRLEQLRELYGCRVDVYFYDGHYEFPLDALQITFCDAEDLPGEELPDRVLIN